MNDENPQQMALVQREQTNTSMMSPADIKAKMDQLKAIMNMIMVEGVHYGTIPGTGKPTLFQPGAQAIAVGFHLAPRYTIVREDLGNFHREYEVTCELYLPNGQYVGAGVGTATTLESRYRYRNAQLTCPECGKEGTVIKGKAQYGGGYLCFDKKGGCGAKWADDDPAIADQHPGKSENPDPADCWNTVKKIGCKRAFVHAVITATGASDVFTQDLEDGVPFSPDATPPAVKKDAPPRNAAPQRQAPQRRAAPAAQEGPPAGVDQRLATPAQIGFVMKVCKEADVPEAELKAFCAANLKTITGLPVQSRNDIKKGDVDTILRWLRGELVMPPSQQDDLNYGPDGDPEQSQDGEQI